MINQKLNNVIELLKTGQKEKAQVILDEILAADPKNPNALYFSALIYVDNKDFVKAREYALRGIEVNPCFELFTTLGDTYYTDKNFEEAEKAYQNALKHNPNSSEIHLVLGITQEELGQKDQAQNSYLKALQLNPKLELGYERLGNIYYAKNLLNEAMKCYENAYKINPKSHIHLCNIGNIFKKAAQHKNAVKYYQKALELCPDDAETNESIGLCYSSMNDLGNAIRHLEKALLQNPSNASILAELGNISYRNGQINIAKEYYNRLKASDPTKMELSIQAGNDIRYQFWIANRDERISYKAKENGPKFAIIYFYENNFNQDQYEKFITEMENQNYKNYGVFSTHNLETELERIKEGYTHICFVEQGDKLHKDALCAFAEQLNNDSSTEIIYTDEDVFDEKYERSNPHFKPEFNRFLLYSQNYMNGLLCLKLNENTTKTIKDTPIINQTTLYKYVLELTEESDKPHRIPDVLYHRSIKNQAKIENTSYADVVKQQLNKKEYKYEFTNLKQNQVNSIKFLNKTTPKISIIIPFKDKLDYTKRCVESIEKTSTYKNYEIILINNRSEEQATLDYIAGSNHKVINADIPFNFAELNNIGAKEAQGEFLLFLNNDMSIISPDWIETTLALAELPEVGIVGAKLLFENGMLQHVGIVNKNARGHTFHINGRQKGNSPTYKNYSDVVREYSYVTGAFMMVKKDKFNKVSGFDEAFLIEKNDTDLCLKMLKEGYINLYNSQALLFHYESISRKNSGHISKEATEYYINKWQDVLSKPDPCYNPNLSKLYNNYIVSVEQNL